MKHYTGLFIKRRGPGIFTGYYERGPLKEIPSCLIPRLLCCISLATWNLSDSLDYRIFAIACQRVHSGEFALDVEDLSVLNLSNSWLSTAFSTREIICKLNVAFLDYFWFFLPLTLLTNVTAAVCVQTLGWFWCQKKSAVTVYLWYSRTWRCSRTQAKAKRRRFFDNPAEDR